jgi:hypothetical protein
MKDYLNILKPMIDIPLMLIHEGFFILKIFSEDKKNNFLNLWKEIDLQTRPHQKLAYGLLGAMEGLIIYISLIKSDILIEWAKGDIDRFLYSKIKHLGTTDIKHMKIEKTLI